MKSATMLYRLGQKVIIWGTPMDTIVVDGDEVQSYLDDGWFAHPDDVKSPCVIMDTASIANVESEKPRRGRPPKSKE